MANILKIIAIALAHIILIQFSNAQTPKSDPVYWNIDFTIGETTNGRLGGGLLKFHYDRKIISIGYRRFTYLPKDLPEDFIAPSRNAGKPTDFLNANSLLYVGIGRYVTNFQYPARILIQAGGVIGAYKEANNFKKLLTSQVTSSGSSGFCVICSGPPIVSNYSYSYEKGFTAGVHILSKAELCTRGLSIGINLEGVITTSTYAIGAGISIGFGKMRT